MPINLSALSSAQNTAQNLSNLILVSPEQVGYQPQSIPNNDGTVPDQPAKFLFDIEGEQTATLSCDVTDHYIEDNTAIQDQVAIKPVIVTTSAFVGELNDIAPLGLQTLKQAADKLIPIAGYAPELTVSALIAYNTAAAAYATAKNLANNAVTSWNTINGNDTNVALTGNVSDISSINNAKNQTKQQLAFQKFYGYLQERRLFTVQTPWAVFKNMIIMNLRSIQDADTRVISNFEIQFKQLRFAQTLVSVETISRYSYSNFEGRAYNQGSPLVNLGSSNLTDGTSSQFVLG